MVTSIKGKDLSNSMNEFLPLMPTRRGRPVVILERGESSPDLCFNSN